MIDLKETFDDPWGRFLNYDTYNVAQKFGFLPNQKHIDIRAFDPGESGHIDMVFLSTQTMSVLNTETMTELDGNRLVAAEVWNSGTLAPLTSRNYWNTLSWTLSAGQNNNVSTLVTATGGVVGLDLETGFEDTDVISVALPIFPIGSITTASSYIDFTSNPDGTFNSAESPIARVRFSDSTVPLVSGNSELRFPRSAITGIDLSSVTGIRFSIAATGTATFRCNAIRLLASSWVYSDLDVDTINQRLSKPVSLNSDIAATVDPTSDPYPVLIRSDDSYGPAPINVNLSATFNPGSRVNEGDFTLFFRQKSIDYTTMLDLDGTEVGDLDGQVQPNFSPGRFVGRTMVDLDGLDQSDLDPINQFVLERKPDPLSAAYLQVNLAWNGASTSLTVTNAEHDPAIYTFAPPTLTANQEYAIIVDLEEETMRVWIYELVHNALSNLVFDSSLMVNDAFLRYNGRVAWIADFADGNAYLSDIRPRHLMFAEMRSNPYLFQTKVRGVRVQAGATEPTNLFLGIDEGPWGGYFQAFPQRGPEAFRIIPISPQQWQGIRTNFIEFDDFTETTVELDLFVSQALLDVGTIDAFLWDGVTPLSLPISPLKGNVWNHITIDMSCVTDRLTGSYAIVLAQTNATNSAWAVDKIRVWRNNINWEARDFTYGDSWDALSDEWIAMGPTINGTNDGVVLRDQANSTQIKAQALRENATIGELRVIPQYAQLGRIVFAEDYPPGKYLDDANFPNSAFTKTHTGRTYTVTSTATVPLGNQYITQTVWTWGDGFEDIGNVVSHTYAEPGVYVITQQVTDNFGMRDSSHQSVTIT